MPKYLISWTEETYMNNVIEADSADEALDKFYNGEFDIEKNDVSESDILDGSVEAEVLDEE